MRVKFYNLEKILIAEGILKGSVQLKGEKKGEAILKDGRLHIKVKDEKLRTILKRPYPVPMKTKKRGASFSHYTKEFPPGTRDHLRAIAYACWQFGYLAEVHE